MEAIERPKAEYGGFLPLELNPGKEYFAQYEESLYRFNSVKAALDAIIRELNPDEIFVPYYYCPSTTEAVKNTGVKVSFYHIDESLLPIDIPDNEKTAIILVDYFGICADNITDVALSFSNADIVIDRAHAFFEKPVKGKHIHNVYSAKKFFGIPDGAYLVTDRNVSEWRTTDRADTSFSNGYATFLLRAYEEGTNAAYSMKKDADKLLKESYAPMSLLAKGLMQNADHGRVEQQRKENYKALYGYLGNINELDVPAEKPSYVFPLLNSKHGSRLKKALVEEHIYVPTLWSGADLLENGSDFELNMKDNCVFLPVDQRYNMSDMTFIAQTIKNILGEVS